jgi:hypothetical protein
MGMDEPIEIIPLTGFDPEGEPEIRVMADGSGELVFNFMPPSWAEDNPERFDDFDRQLAKAAGMDVEWDDREVFRFPGPVADGVVDRLRGFLEHYSGEDASVSNR